MYGIYYNRTTPFLAFLEGMVRVFDCGALLKLRRRWRKRDSEPEPESRKDDGWSARIVDWYIRDAIATFESQESGKLSEDPMLPRRSFATADIVLGPLSTQEVILRYEELVSGACDRIMDMASERLNNDGKTEIALLTQRAKQGYMGVAAGFILAMLLIASALYLFFSGHGSAGFSVVGICLAIPVLASVYVSKAQVREKLYNRDFFPKLYTKGFFSRKRRKP